MIFIKLFFFFLSSERIFTARVTVICVLTVTPHMLNADKQDFYWIYAAQMLRLTETVLNDAVRVDERQKSLSLVN